MIVLNSPLLFLLPRSERAGARVGERRRFAEAVAAARRLPCGARAREAAAELALRPAAFGAQTVLADPAAPGNLTSPVLLGASETRRHSPTRAPANTGVCPSTKNTGGGSKAGADGCVGAYAALSIAAQRGESVVLNGPARRIYAVPRSAAMRSHRSRPAEREAQGTRSAAEGAASKPEHPSAPALPLHCGLAFIRTAAATRTI
jgi:hypothetical protein